MSSIFFVTIVELFSVNEFSLSSIPNNDRGFWPIWIEKGWEGGGVEGSLNSLELKIYWYERRIRSRSRSPSRDALYRVVYI